MRVTPFPTLRPERGCVVSYCSVASSMGGRVLREGGNAVDAAVVVALALAVTYPQAGNLGGGGFVLLHLANGDVHSLDFRETAPAAITPAHLAQDAHGSIKGARAVAVPGTVAGLAALLERFGTWSWERVLEPAIKLADNGFWLTMRQAAYLELYTKDLAAYPTTRGIFTEDGEPLRPGTLLRQPELAAAMRRLASAGARDFYQGQLADQLVETLRRDGGVMVRKDLEQYEPKWRTPLRSEFRGHDVVTAGLPSGGGLIIHLSLALMERSGALLAPHGSLERLQLTARAFRVAFGLMRDLAADPDYLSAEDLKAFDEAVHSVVSAGDLETLERQLARARKGPGPDRQGDNTTHFCVLDKHGNGVSATVSLNTLFGSKLAVEGAGILLNNCLDDFLLSPDAPNWYDLVPGHRNLLHPCRRAVSSMAPTIIRREGAAELLVGGSGGPRIPTLVSQLVVGTLVDGLTLSQAVQAPRIHHQYSPDTLAVEDAMAPELVSGLAARSKVERMPRLGIGIGIHRKAKDDVSVVFDSRFSFE